MYKQLIHYSHCFKDALSLLCWFPWGPLLKILRTSSLHFPRHLFLFNPLCYYTAVFNVCTELMFGGPAMTPFCQKLRRWESSSPSQMRSPCRRDTLNTTRRRQGWSGPKLKQDGASLSLGGALYYVEHLSKLLGPRLSTEGPGAGLGRTCPHH